MLTIRRTFLTAVTLSLFGHGVAVCQEKATEAGFKLTQLQEIGPHYVRTLKIWADALEAHKDEAIAIQGQEVYDRYDKYLNGCQRYFASGHISVHQFTLQK